MPEKPITKLNVILWGKKIGFLTWDEDKNISVFQLSPAFEEFGFPISPISHKRHNGGKEMASIYGDKGDKYQGLPPFLSDSLPDEWGNRLFDEWLSKTKTQIPASKINPLHKLAFIGKRGMGAFEYVPELDVNPTNPDYDVDIAKLYEKSLDILHERESVSSHDEDLTLDKLILLGTSAGGKHAKGIIAINKNTGEIRSGQVTQSKDFKYYIIKFKEDQDVPTSEIEMVYHDMAVSCGINMTECRLIEIEGIKHFITGRFDRKNEDKILSQTLAAIAPRATDYTNLFRLVEKLRLPGGTKEQLFTRMVFNYVAGVTDDHDKNFSFLMDKQGNWSLSPAYDLIFTANIWKNRSAETHSLGISGKHSHVTLNDLKEFGEDFEIKNTEDIINSVFRAVQQFPILCRKYNVPEKWTSKLLEAMNAVFPEREIIQKTISISDRNDLKSLGIDDALINVLEKSSHLQVDTHNYRPANPWDNNVPQVSSTLHFAFHDGNVYLLTPDHKREVPLQKALRDIEKQDIYSEKNKRPTEIASEMQQKKTPQL